MLTPASPTNISLPQLIALQYQVKHMAALRQQIRSPLSGAHISRLRGRGMEFEEVRVYQAGDDVSMIDWKVTARKGVTHTKIFREERERPVWLTLDYRPSMFFATQGALKAVVATQAAAMLAWHGIAHGDRLGASIFSGDLHQDTKPKRGRQGVLACLHACCTHPAWQQRRAGLDISALQETLHRLRRTAVTGSLIYVLSDFRGLDEAVKASLLMLARHHELVLVHVYDGMEANFPERGVFPVFDGEKVTVYHANSAMRQALQAQFEQRVTLLQDLQRQHGIHVVSLQTHEDVALCIRERLWQR